MNNRDPRATYVDNPVNPHGTPDYWLAANPPPTFTNAFIVPENQTAVATLASTPPATFAKSGGADAAKFNLTIGGVLTFVSAPDFEAPGDANADNVYLVQVTATNANGLTERTVSVTVTDAAGA